MFHGPCRDEGLNNAGLHFTVQCCIIRECFAAEMGMFEGDGN